MENLEKLISECSSVVLTNQSMKKISGGFTQIISNENSDQNGDGKPDDCNYDDDPSKTGVPPVTFF